MQALRVWLFCISQFGFYFQKVGFFFYAVQPNKTQKDWLSLLAEGKHYVFLCTCMRHVRVCTSLAPNA